MSVTEARRQAEIAARVYLEMRGFTIIEQNFRRPRSLIDIIAQKDKAVHFIEIKYSQDGQFNASLDLMTLSKLRQMSRAVDIWIEEVKWRGEYVLSAIEIAGPTFAVLNFSERI